MEKTIFDTQHLKKNYFKMAAPVVLGMIVTLIYNLADTFFIAQTGNTSLVAGVSVCSPVFTALMAFGNIYGQGGSSVISRLLGQDEKESVGRISSFCFYIAILTGILLAVLMLALRTPLLSVLGAKAETWTHASQYYTVLAIGSPIVVLSFIHSNLVRCEGLASESMIGSIFGTVVNIILDPILISVFGLGALGAAIATVLGYLCSDIFFLFLLPKRSQCLSVSLRKCRVNRNELGQIFGIGTTSAITNLMQSVTIVLLNQSLLLYGNEKIAAMGIVLKINMIAQLLLTGFAFGGVPLFGYLYGAGKKEKLHELLRFCLAFLCGLSLVLTVLLFVSAPGLISVFMKDTQIITLGTPMLRFQTAGTVFAAVVLLMTVLFQAAGRILPAFIMSLSRQGIVFIVLLILLRTFLGYNGILAAQAAADLLSALLAVVLYRKAMK